MFTNCFLLRPATTRRRLLCPLLSGRRFIVGNAVGDAAVAAARFLDKHSGAVVVRRQLIDANQLHKLALTLQRPIIAGIDVSAAPPPPGTPVPPGYHLVYFTPVGAEADLGPDGTDRDFNAPEPFSRRMWAGGAMEWPSVETSAALRVGDEAEERTRLLSATPKTSSSGSQMVLVQVEKEIWSPRGLAVVDRRSWVFRPAVQGRASASTVPFVSTKTPQKPTQIWDEVGPGVSDAVLRRHFCWSPVGLFRFSALTFNGHKIHYNEQWAQHVEDHAGLVVHGPLNLINILNYWQDVHCTTRSVCHISYRATAPLYAGESYHVRTETVREGAWVVVAARDRTVCMVAEIS